MARKSDDIQRVLAVLKRSDIHDVTLKFIDLLGRWHQVTLPVSNFGAETFSKGVAFDGSSVHGFTRLESGDLRLIPDPTSYFFENFAGMRSVSFICDCIEAHTRKRFARDPRCVVDEAERFLGETGIADQAFFMPELEFNLFDEVMLFGASGTTGYTVRSEEAGLLPAEEFRTFPWIESKGGYHAVTPRDRFQSLRSAMVEAMEEAGIAVKYSHHEVGSAGQCEIEVRFMPLRKAADQIMIAKYLIKNIAADNGVVATFIPKPLFGQPGNGMHFHQYLAKKGKNVFFKKGGYGNLSKIALYYVGGLLKHGRALLALTCASTNSYKRLVPGFEAPTCFVFAIGNRSAAVRIPKDINVAKDARVEFRPSDGTANGYLATAAMLMAGIDGIRSKIDPEKAGFGPFDFDVSNLDDLDARGIAAVPFTLEEALEALRCDHDFLLEGGVFSRDLIDIWIELKYTLEVNALRHRPHPYEIEFYMDC
jgi:glutamine synthetase